MNLPDHASVGAPGSFSAVGELIGPVCATPKTNCSVMGSASTTLGTPFVAGALNTSRLESGHEHGCHEFDG